jgi:hypothetical protein
VEALNGYRPCQTGGEENPVFDFLFRRVDTSGAYGKHGDGGARTVADDPLPAIEILNAIFFDAPADAATDPAAAFAGVFAAAAAAAGEAYTAAAAAAAGDAYTVHMLAEAAAANPNATEAAAVAAAATTGEAFAAAAAAVSGSTPPEPTSPPVVTAGTDLLHPSFIVPCFGGLGFTGNEDNYYDRWNSSLALVLTHRAGIPISMSIMYAAVARRAGLAVHFVNAPGHFMSRVGPTAQDPRVHLIDVFNRGNVTSMPGSDFHPQFLQTPEARDVCVRVLNNLRMICGDKSEGKSPFNIIGREPLRFALASATIALMPTHTELREERLALATGNGYFADAVEDMHQMIGRACAPFYAQTQKEKHEKKLALLRAEFREKSQRLLPTGTIVQVGKILSIVPKISILSGFLGNRISLLPVFLGTSHPAVTNKNVMTSKNVVKLDKLPEETLRNRDHMLILGDSFESFDVQRGGAVQVESS